MGKELEALIDKCGLCAVLQSIASICGEKAEHVQVNWQDRDLSKAWTRCAGIVDAAAARVKKVGLP